MVVDLENTIRELAPGLLRYCIARTRDNGLAEEIAQESLAALVQRWRRHGMPDSPQAFVFSVARRRSTRALIRRRVWLPLDFLAGRRDRAPDPERTALDKSDCTAMVRALERLNQGEREALLVVAVGGLATAEAARTLGLSESALKMRVLRARKRLRVYMGNGHAPGR
jgi:RNA polymerase sigma factor (sigma-70 family)